MPSRASSEDYTDDLFFALELILGGAPVEARTASWEEVPGKTRSVLEAAFKERNVPLDEVAIQIGVVGKSGDYGPTTLVHAHYMDAMADFSLRLIGQDDKIIGQYEN